MPLAGRTVDPLDLLWGVLSFPPTALLVAVVATTIILVVSREPGMGTVPPSVNARYLPEVRVLAIVAVTVVVVFFGEFVIRGYLVTGPGLLPWWRFAVPLACAVVGLSIVLGVVVTRGASVPEAPVLTAARRGWTSFSSRAELAVAAIVALVSAATTIAAGLASSPDDDGNSTWLVIPIPNEAAIDPIRLPFFGWSYGVPVLVCLVSLAAAAWAVLDRNAARPFLRAETVVAERRARRATAAGTTRIAMGATLLSVAEAWRLIAASGTVSTLSIGGGEADATYDAAWRYAELAVMAGWSAPVLETAALVLLLLTAARGWRRPPIARESAAVAAEPAGAVAVK